MRTRSKSTNRVYIRGGKGYSMYLSTAWSWLKIKSGEPCAGIFAMFGDAAKATLSTTIVDTSTIVDNPHGRKQISPCRHYKTEYGNGEFDRIVLNSGIAGNANAHYSWDKQIQQTPPSVSGLDLPAFGAWDLYQAQSRAWRELQPVLRNNAGFSGSNFLFEMKELRGAPAQILRIGRGILSAAKHMTRRQSSLTLAEGTLAYNYGFAPLVSDISAFSVICGDFTEAVRKHNRNATTWKTHHYSEKIPTVQTKSGTGTYVYYQGTSGRFNASVRVKSQEINPRNTDAAREFYGLTLTPAQVWNMIPFSFLIDQFLTVGKSLEQLSRTPIPGTQHGAFLCSIELEAAKVMCLTQNYYLRYFNGGCGNQGLDCEDDHPIAYVKKRSYDRFIDLPPNLGGVPVPQFKMPSFTSILNDVALLRTGVGWKGR